MVFFNFLNFFAIVLEFSITRQVGTINFIFSLSPHFQIYFGLKGCHNGIFEFFLLFFCNFLLCVGLERNRTKRQFLFSLFLCVFHPILAWKEAIMAFLNFLNFFAIFLEFCITHRVGTERNGTIIFITVNFGLKWSHNGIF